MNFLDILLFLVKNNRYNIDYFLNGKLIMNDIKKAGQFIIPIFLTDEVMQLQSIRIRIDFFHSYCYEVVPVSYRSHFCSFCVPQLLIQASHGQRSINSRE